MGFSIKKTMEQEKDALVRVPLSVNVIYEDRDPNTKLDIAPDHCDVVHVFRLPTVPEREKYQQMMVKVRGQSIRATGYQEATLWLWSQCIKSLEGYDDLPPTKDQYIKVFKESAILHIHAERATEALLTHLNASEDDILKK